MSEEIKKNLDFMELGISGLNRMAGDVYEEFLKELQGTKGVQAYKEMRDNDAVVGGALFAIEMLIRQADWRVEPFSDDPIDVERAEFVESVIADMETSWDEVISEILTMLPYGWALHEIVYKKRNGFNQDEKITSKFNDGKVGWRKLPLRAQETLFEWKFDTEGNVLAMVQQAPPDYDLRTIPVEKALLFRTKIQKGNPEGRSILRNAYRSFYFKKHIENIEGIGIERDLAGLPVALVPPELLSACASPEARATRAEIEKIIKNIRRDEQEGVIFPMARDDKGQMMFELKLLSTGGSRQFDTDKIINRHNRAIAGSMLADFILLGHQNVGSFALSSDKTAIFSTAIGAWLKAIAGVMNSVALPRLFRINGMSTENMPEFKPGDIESVDLDSVSNFLQRLTASGAAIFPDPDIENFLLRSAGLPEKDFHNAQNLDLERTDGTLLREIQQAVGDGTLKRETAAKMIEKGFRVSRERADSMLS